jgi:hypothetical protein
MSTNETVELGEEQGVALDESGGAAAEKKKIAEQCSGVEFCEQSCDPPRPPSKRVASEPRLIGGAGVASANSGLPLVDPDLFSQSQGSPSGL